MPLSRELSATEAPTTALEGIGPALQQRLAARGLHTVEDLLYLLPLDYEDRRRVTPLNQAGGRAGRITVRGTVARRRFRRTRGRGRMLELWLADGVDAAPALHAIWFRCNPGLAAALPKGVSVLLTGQVRESGDLPQMAHPDFVQDPDGDGSAGICPRYPEVEGVAPARLRRAIGQACREFLPALPDGVPARVAHELGLPTQAAALAALHLQGAEPADEELAQLARGDHLAHRRLALDEHFSLQLAVARRERRWGDRAAPPCRPGSGHDAALRRCLPFSLTAAQERTLGEIRGDMQQPRPMHRLLQGDVGSGKTAVAFGAAWAALAVGKQAAIMAPTEILARQHYQVLDPWCRRLDRRAALLTASTTGAAREALLAAAAGGSVDLLVGTHALLSEQVSLPQLALAVVDEQHRFGVDQRARLRQQGPGGELPHLLVMTATPIPRSLALTVYGDLDLSLLDEKPPGRRPAQTRVFRGAERNEAYGLVERQLAAGQQVFVVCPLVEASDALAVADATGTAAALRERLGAAGVGLVHGRLAARERDDTMTAFRRGELRLLVATTVIEVVIDVPQAGVMVVEHADRFGLAQLHQLRGRVGRGEELARCLLLTDAEPDSAAHRRLEVLASTPDGFEVAEADLRLRGAGEAFGTRQWGEPRLRFACLAHDLEVLLQARQAAREVVGRDAGLVLAEHQQAREVMERRWPDVPLMGAEAG